MDQATINNILNPTASFSPTTSVIGILLLIWSLSWKAGALWHAAKNEEKLWYVAILVVNLIGILEIVYLFFLSKNKITTDQAQTNVKKFISELTSTKPKRK